MRKTRTGSMLSDPLHTVLAFGLHIFGGGVVRRRRWFNGGADCPSIGRIGSIARRWHHWRCRHHRIAIFHRNIAGRSRRRRGIGCRRVSRGIRWRSITGRGTIIGIRSCIRPRHVSWCCRGEGMGNDSVSEPMVGDRPF